MQNAGASRREPKATVNLIVACCLIARCTYAKFMCVKLSEPKNHIVSVWLASFPGFPLAFISPAVEKLRESLGDLLTCPTYYDVTSTPFDRNAHARQIDR